MTLQSQMRNRIQTGLLRRAVNTASVWAEKYRMMGKPIPGYWTFKYHPWLRDMHDSHAEHNIGQKAAQMGFTETMLNLVFYKIDVCREDCLYVLPNKTPDATDFSVGRFDSALEMSPHLSGLFSDIKNVGHKRAGSTNLYIRGSRGRSGLKSVPAPNLFFDERDEMDQKQVTLGYERASGQFQKMIWEISTPSITDFGINSAFQLSTQEHFFFVCPCCSRNTELIFPECLKVRGDGILDPDIYESRIICRECKNDLPHDKDAKAAMLKYGYWNATGPKVETRGFYVNQLYSATIKPWEIAKHIILAETNQGYEQELYNSKMGLPHTVEGAQVTLEKVNACIRNYRLQDPHDVNVLTTMGIDVGTWLHVIINQWLLPSTLGNDLNTTAIPKVIYIGKVKRFEELDRLMRDFSINQAVIDMFPERRLAKQFADRFPGYVKLCYYARGIAGRSMVEPKDENELVVDWRINVDRTGWLDTTLGRFHNSRIMLPQDTPSEYVENIKAMIRKPGVDAYDNPTVDYVKPENVADHYAHAQTYAEIALPLAISASTGRDIKAFL